MYNIPYFKEEDGNKILDFIKAHPFAMLIGSEGSRPVATQVPMLVEPAEHGFKLTGHIMKNTDHHKAFIKNPEALCVFTGAHSYVSAQWYNNQQTASTWNYLSVHVRGQIEFIEGEGLRKILEQTTAHFEGDPASPSLMKHMPEDYISRLEKAIVGLVLHVSEIDNVFKLSQNKTEEEKARILSGLSQGSEEQQSMAREMQNRL